MRDFYTLRHSTPPRARGLGLVICPRNSTCDHTAVGVRGTVRPLANRAELGCLGTTTKKPSWSSGSQPPESDG
eukprot:2926348-Pyramimonas_sp.AAC.1